jgi:hypothetical protein
MRKAEACLTDGGRTKPPSVCSRRAVLLQAMASHPIPGSSQKKDACTFSVFLQFIIPVFAIIM